jgi:hypothetical protein
MSGHPSGPTARRRPRSLETGPAIGSARSAREIADTEIAPNIKRVAMIFNPATAPGGGSYFLPLFEAAARSFRVEPIIEPVHSDAEIESVITGLGRGPKGGLVLQTDAFLFARRAPIIALAAQNNVPAIYPWLDIPRGGGLLSYGSDMEDIWRRAAPYVDRILRGSASPSRKRCWPRLMRSFNETPDLHRGVRERGGVADGRGGAAAGDAGN